jgi:DNA-binding XRE family transcriptional regulator
LAGSGAARADSSGAGYLAPRFHCDHQRSCTPGQVSRARSSSWRDEAEFGQKWARLPSKPHRKSAFCRCERAKFGISELYYEEQRLTDSTPVSGTNFSYSYAPLFAGSADTCTDMRACNSLTVQKALALPQHRGELPECLNTLGDHIRKKRLNLGLTQREVAHLIGVEQCSVYNWEKRGMNPAQRVQTAIIHFLGYDPNQNGGSPSCTPDPYPPIRVTRPPCTAAL